MNDWNDLISRKKLLKAFFPNDTFAVDPKDYAINAEAVRKAIMDAPSATIVIEVDADAISKAINDTTRRTGKNPLWS